jgi:D-alanyl-D-alanine carboxypeptidase
VIALHKDFPGYYPLFSLKEFEFNGIKYETHNNVLLEYEGAEGMKTGFTNAAGFNLISSAKKSDARIVSILLSCASSYKRDLFTKDLLDKSFANLGKDTKIEGLNKILGKFDYKDGKKRYHIEEMHFSININQ